MTTAGREELALHVSGVRKSYSEIQALVGVDLDIRRGEVLGVLGPNGAGKTTLVSIAVGLLEADSGTVSIFGQDVTRSRDVVLQRVGLAPQELGIYPTISVLENMKLFARLRGLRGRRAEQRIADVAEALSIGPFLLRPARSMSGGEKRRLHTALALLGSPDLLILDEPTSGVDVATRAQMLELFHELGDDGRAVWFSTHYPQELEGLANSVAILDKGRVLARGTVESLVEQYGELTVKLRFEGDASSDRPTTRLVRANGSAGEAIAQAVMALGAERDRLCSVEAVSSSLESVFLHVTRGRYQDAEDAGLREEHGSVA